MLGFSPDWSEDYSFKLAYRGCKRFIGTQASRKQPITPSILVKLAPLFKLDNPMHAAMWALFLVDFFSFLRKSNLVVHSVHSISRKVPCRRDLCFTPDGAVLKIRETKTIQFFQRALSIPMPSVSRSVLCPIAALQNHLRVNAVADRDPLFSVRQTSGGPIRPITQYQFSNFLAKALAAIDLEPRLFSPHSFRRGGATFAFECSIPRELIKLQGDWRSDACLTYLEMSDEQKRHAVTAMASRLVQISSHI
jgi:hypothetical protein